MAVVSNGFLPAWALAKEAWPGVCQSCVTTMLSNEAASLLINGTTSAPPFTGSVPPSMKQFWTSTTIRADFASGLMLWARAGCRVPIPAARQKEAVEPRKRRRDRADDATTGMATSSRDATPSLEHIPFGWNQPNGMCPLKQQLPGAHFRSGGTASGSTRSEIALANG